MFGLIQAIRWTQPLSADVLSAPEEDMIDESQAGRQAAERGASRLPPQLPTASRTGDTLPWSSMVASLSRSERTSHTCKTTRTDRPDHSSPAGAIGSP